MVRSAFVHDAVVVMGALSEVNDPGGAVTRALCGGWDHPPPCPLAPHHVSFVADGDTVRLRVVFGTVDVIATLAPHNALTSVDLPTFGRPATPTKPDFTDAVLLRGTPSHHPLRS